MPIVDIYLKDPDRVGDAIDEATRTDIAELTSLSEEERDMLYDSRREKIAEACERWIEYQEYIRVRIDTAAGTAEVVPVTDGHQ